MRHIKFRFPFLFIFILALFSNYISSQQNNLQYNEWIKSWYLLGPVLLEESVKEVNHLVGFENDFLELNGGETNFQFKEHQTETFGGTSLKWIRHTSSDSIINLDEIVSKQSFVSAYAYTEVYTEAEKTVILSLGTNDGGRLWVNGNQVWDYTNGRGLKPDNDLIPILFKKGKNTILLKIEERGNNWAFCLRLLQFNIDTFTRSGKLFDVVTLQNGDSELRFSLNENVIENLFNDVNLSVFNGEKESIEIWEGNWTKKNKMNLPINSRGISPFVIKINAMRKDGKEWNHEIQFNSGKKIKYNLFKDKKTDYKIVISEDAFESEKWAADELQEILWKISGINFKIISDKTELTNNEIIIGYNQHSQKLLGHDYHKPISNDESFTYKNINSNIVLLGGQQRGTMYAVFSFLENVFGVRWYTPKVTSIPQREKYCFDYIYHHEEPSIQVRNDFYYEAFDPIWAAHNKVNGAMGYREQHGGIEAYWAVHTFYRFIPPSEFYGEHPEYFSLIDGKRIHDHAQLCLTNSDVLSIVVDRLKKVMKENPTNLIYSVSQNDWRNPCECDNCQNIVDKLGSQSGIMVWFVNQVADRIKDEFPDKYVGTLAYQYTRKPPTNIKPNNNVVIRLCSIECCFAHEFTSCPENQEFLSDLESWSDISPHLYIWDYVVNFSHYIMPYPNFNVLQPNIRTFKKNNSIGIMEQAAYQSRGGEFSELRAYLISKLLWNVECDVDEVIDDFIYGYYGRSGQHVRAYFNLLHQQIRSDTHIHLGLTPDDRIFSDEFTSEADKIFDKAEIAAENSEIRNRVEMARLPLMYMKCRRNPLKSIYDGTYDRINKVVEREGITHFAEAGKTHIEDFHQQIKNAK